MKMMSGRMPVMEMEMEMKLRGWKCVKKKKFL